MKPQTDFPSFLLYDSMRAGVREVQNMGTVQSSGDSYFLDINNIAVRAACI